MRDPSSEIKKAYYDLLNGNTALDVYTMLPQGIDDFIFVGDFTIGEDIAKDTWITDCTIQIEILRTYRNQGTKTEVDSDANIITQLVRDNFASGVTLTNFSVPITTLDGSNDFVEETDEFKIYRKFLRFRLTVEEK